MKREQIKEEILLKLNELLTEVKEALIEVREIKTELDTPTA